MKHLVDSVRSAVEAKNWYAALGMALTLPDICGRLEDPKKGSQKRYEDWCGRYLVPTYTTPMPGEENPFAFLTGGDCYALRCAVLHEGRDDIVDQRARKALSEFKFQEPDEEGNSNHNIKVNGLLLLSVAQFCTDVCDGADEWLGDVQGDAEIAMRMRMLMTLAPPGEWGF